MIDTKALREKVLDLAIRGKLVPQDPDDEPASVLLERIHAEKEQMVKDGKLKAKDIKNDTIIFKGDDNLHYERFPDGTVKCIEDEIPFELPNGWAWTRIGNIASVRGGKRIPKGMSFSNKKTDHAYIRVTDMKNQTVNTSDLKYIDDVVFSKIKNYIVEKNDLYITIAGTIGAVGEIPDELEGMNLTENAVRVTDIKINKTFLCLMMQSNLVKNQFKYKTYQVAMPKLGLERILTTLIPVCSFKTQENICVRIEQIKQLTNVLDCEYSELNNIITILKLKILDLAIRGKLVPQNPDDEPASILLERIRAEKEELIRQGKIKRDKKESVIFKGEDNSYYDIIIPQSWEFVNLSVVTLNISDGSHNPPPKKTKGVPLLSATNIYDNKINYTSATRWITEDEWIIENARTKIEVGDVLITIVGTIGRTAVVSDATRFALQRSVAVMKPNMIVSKYLMYVLQAPMIIDWLNTNAKGNAQVGIYLKDLARLSFPLPPLAEQKRIVEAIEIAFAQLDEILNSIS